MFRKTLIILAMLFAILGPGAKAWGQASDKYVKVTSAPTDWSGEYLLVYESSTTAGVAWTGVDAANCNVAVTISDGEIADKPETAVTLTIATMNDGYSIKVNGGTNNGKYIKGTSEKNALEFDSNAQLNTLSYDATDKGVTITSNTSVMRYNPNKDNYRFRYFKSGSYSSQKIIQLYKLQSSPTEPTCTIDPTEWDFGDVEIDNSVSKTFTVTTANLTGDLTLGIWDGPNFSVSPETIPQNATENVITVTCTPTDVGELEDLLNISGGGLAEDVQVVLTATGLCTAPKTPLSYETPIFLTLAEGEVETTLTPIEDTGNESEITYELIEGDEDNVMLDENTFTAYAVGSYTVRATQDLNGTTCGGTFDIVINVTSSTTPTCFVNPTNWYFGDVEVGNSVNKTFTVTTANLTDDLTLNIQDGTNFSFSPGTIEQDATETEITVTCTATAAGELEDILIISGDGLEEDVEVKLTATGIELYTVSFSAVNGTEPASQQQTAPEASIILPTITDVDCNAWQFAGWSESEISTEAPTLLAGGNYTPTENVTLYAVYKKAEASEPTQVSFVFADIAKENNWENSQAYTSVVIAPVTITANGGGNNGKYYTSDQTWRMYNGGSVTITSTGNNITAVSSDPSKTFTINNGEASLNISATTNFKSITVTCTPPTSFSYSTTPSCLEIVATPTITPNGGDFVGSQEITLECATEDATISYTFDNWETSNVYSAPFTITETTTIKAKANKDGMSESEVATATFTKIPVLETMQEIFDASATAGNYYVKFNNYVVSGVTSSNAYITDGEKGFIVYKSSHGFAVGDILNGTVQLALTRYCGAAEFTNLTSSTMGLTVTKNGSITPVEANIANLGGVNTGAVITLNNVTYSGSDNIFTDGGGNGIKAYNTFMTLPSFMQGCNYNMTGVYIQYNSTKEIAPRSEADIVLIVDAPTFNPEGGYYNAAQTVAITSATTGATIYYTLDNSDPTTESTLYTGPIEISENTTIKAIAVKNGVSSEIATAVYNITITTVATPTFEPEDGTYFDENLEVSLACVTDGATIVYTTDNWTTSSNYTAPFTITETTTVKAKATKTDMDDSAIAEATFTKRYKVNYVVNGNGSLFEPTYVTPGEAIGTLPTPTAIPTGFDFAGWSDSESSISTIGETYIVNADVTLYAVFSREVPSPSTEEAVTIIDGSELTSTATTGDSQLTIDGKNIVLSKGAKQQASSGDNRFSDEAILIGRKDAYIYNTTSFDNISKFEIYANKGASAKVSVGINFSTSAISSYSETADNTWAETLSTLDNVYDASEALPTGAKYFWYQVTNDNNSQVQFRITYQKTTTTIEYYIRVFEESVVDDLTVESPMIITGGHTLTVTNNLEIANNAAFTIEENATVVVNGTLTNLNPENLIIKDGGQLIFNNAGGSKDNDINNSGVKATVEKNIIPYGRDGKGWHFLAAPMEDFAVASFINQANGSGYDLYRWYIKKDETPIWYNYKAHYTEDYNEANGTGFEPNFVSGRGYLAAYQTTDLLKMQGTLNAGTTFDFTEELNSKGNFTLLGNPFTYDLNWSEFTMTDVYNGFAVVGSEDGIIDYVVGNQIIKVGTGFMVYTEGDNATLSFTKGGGSGSGKGNDILALNLFAGNGNGEDNTIIVLDDKNGGFAKASNFNTNVPQIYTEKNQTKYGIRNFSTDTKEFNVSFKAAGEGSNTIRLETIGEFDYVHLYDKLLDVDVDMLLEGSYTFEASEGDDTHRFIVRIDKGNTGINENDNENENFVNVYNGEIHVSGIGEVQIFDVMGRMVHSEVLSGDATISTSNIKDGVYVVRLIGDGWTKAEKIVVRR